MNTQSATQELAYQWQHALRVLRRRLPTVVAFFLVTVGLVAAGTKLQVPVYRATTTVLIDMESPTVLAINRGGEDPTIGQTNYMTYADYYRTQLEIMGGRSLAKRVYLNLKLHEQEPYESLKDPVGAMLGQVTIEPIKQTRLAKIRVEDTNPGRAADIANELGRVYAEQNLAKTIQNEALTLMKNEYLKLQAKEAEVSKRYKAKHPAMLRVHEEMNQLAQMIAQQMSLEHGLHAPRVSGEADADDEDDQGVTAMGVLRHPIVGSLKPNNIRVQDWAQKPGRPVKPNKVLNLALGVLFGVLGGLALLVLQELFDGSVKSPEDVEHDRKLSLLGYIPRVAQLGSVPSSKKKRGQLTSLIERDPYSHLAESYRALRTSLVHALNGNARSPIIFTSPAMSEGKTTTVTNLGVVLAQSGLKILLVDADLRKGRLHELFGMPRAPGLSDALTGKAEWRVVVRPTRVPGLSLISTGSLPKQPAELVSSPAMRQFLATAGEAYDFVLVDSPPVIAVTDAAILASMTKTVVAVAQSGRTPRQALYRLASLCQRARAKLIGIVLNNVPGYDAPVYSRYAAYRYAAADEEGKGAHTR